MVPKVMMHYGGDFEFEFKTALKFEGDCLFAGIGLSGSGKTFALFLEGGILQRILCKVNELPNRVGIRMFDQRFPDEVGRVVYDLVANKKSQENWRDRET